MNREGRDEVIRKQKKVIPTSDDSPLCCDRYDVGERVGTSYGIGLYL
jgi:hypothetical protein